jgi:glycosyltransferase involved in cell wall biosynthesis
MTNKMRVSAVITAYNSEAFVADAILSVLNQTRPVDEIVVVDDGSTDRTREVVEQFLGRSVQYIYQENKGPSAARNHGMRRTTGELLAFLDADDIWLENKNQIQAEYLTNHPHVAMVSGFQWRRVVSQKSRNLVGRIPKDIATLRHEILVRNPIGNPSMVMLRRTVLEEVGCWNEDDRYGRDWELWIRVVLSHNAVILPTPVIEYRKHPENLSLSKRWELLQSYWNISKTAIQSSEPAWSRPGLMVRAWSHITHWRAEYAIKKKYPRWKQIIYAGAALISYPFEDGREKFNALIQSLIGDQLYRSSKRFFRSRLKVRE